MIQYPLTFAFSSKSGSGINTTFESTGHDLPNITCAIPKEFNGPGGGYSPEDLFGLSVLSCLIATFKVFAEKTQLKFSEIKAEGKLIIERGSGGIPAIQKLEIAFTLTGVQDEEKARKILAESEKYCLVSNAIKTEKSFTYSILSE